MSNMYTYTREEAAEILGVSTRTVDRYTKANKIRSQKDGKIVYLHRGDVENMSGNGQKKQEVIVKKEQTSNYSEPTNTTSARPEKIQIHTQELQVKENNFVPVLDDVYFDLRRELQKKDDVIRELSIRVGQAEEMVKHSVSLVDFKKSQFLLEESRTHLSGEIENLSDENKKLKKELSYEKNSNVILIVFVFILLITVGIIWFLSI